MHFEVSHPQGHHNVGCRMGFREHVLDFSTRLDVPFWYIVSLHGLDIAIALFFRNLEPHAFPNPLHDGKGHFWI